MFQQKSSLAINLLFAWFYLLFILFIYLLFYIIVLFLILALYNTAVDSNIVVIATGWTLPASMLTRWQIFFMTKTVNIVQQYRTIATPKVWCWEYYRVSIMKKSTVKSVHAVISIKQSFVLKDHLFLVMSKKVSYELYPL